MCANKNLLVLGFFKRAASEIDLVVLVTLVTLVLVEYFHFFWVATESSNHDFFYFSRAEFVWQDQIISLEIILVFLEASFSELN